MLRQFHLQAMPIFLSHILPIGLIGFALASRYFRLLPKPTVTRPMSVTSRSRQYQS